jgi:hypothetical protein
MAYTKYSLTPADNNAAPPNGAPEGMLPSAVNDTMRDMMAQIRDVGDGIRGGTYTMTAPVITGGSITGVALSGNTLTNPVITGGSINNTTVGATTRSTGAFTTLASNGATTFTAGTASTSTTTGTAVITGGLGVSGRINAANFDGIVGANTAAAGNFTTLGATGVATFSAGTVSAPAITTTGDTNTGIFFPAADTIAFTEGGTESMRIDSTGRLGVGTNNPTVRLDVFSAAGGNIVNFSNGTTTGSLYSDGTQFGLFNSTTTTGYVIVPASTALYLATNGSERMRITSTGNVGIGTNSPDVKLRITGANVSDKGQLLIDSTDFSQITAYNGSTQYGSIVWGTTVSNATAVGMSIGTTLANPLIFNTTATERMRIDSSGNVGIGTSSPGAKLEVNQAAAAFPGFKLTGSNSPGMQIVETSGVTAHFVNDASGVYAGSSTSHPFVLRTNNTERMRIDTSGNVGIGNTPSGTSASGYRSLELGTTAGTGITAGNGDLYIPVNAYVAGGAWKYAVTGQTASLFNAAGNVYTWSQAASGTAGNNISFSERMRITSIGRVGIGVSSPVTTLDVNGDFQTNSTLYAGPITGSATITHRFTAGGSGSICAVRASVLGAVAATSAFTVGQEVDAFGITYDRGTDRRYLLSNTAGGQIFIGTASTAAPATGFAFTEIGKFTTNGLKVTNTVGVGGTDPSTSGAGITFPATQSASSNANTLDDYEEGTFTPTVVYSGTNTPIVSGQTTGRYTKIGRVVSIQLWAAWDENGSTGDVTIGNLPFTSINTVYPTAVASIASEGFTGLPTNISVTGFVTSNSTTLALFLNDNVLNAVSATYTDNDQSLRATFVYEVA